jgi:flavin-dependent dehydrogenase
VERFDVLIVGGGPAGSSAAYGLRGAGLRVGLLDRARFPRDKTCAGWVTPPVFRALEVELDDYARDGRTLQPIRGFRVGRIGGRSTRASGAEIVSHGIRRCELDAYLLARCGAELRLGEPAREIVRVAGRWRVNGAYEARLLVAAGGHFCPVAQAMGAPPPREAPVLAQELELRVDEHAALGLGIDPAAPEIAFTRDLSGYAWVFQKGAWVNVGLGRRGGRVGAELAAFVRARGLPQDWLRAARGHAYLTHGSTRRPLVATGVAWVGDAAGLAYDASGEGIRPAVESGLLLGRALRAACDPADPRALAEYASALRGRFGPRALGQPPWHALPAWKAQLGGALVGIPVFARRVVVKRWFLHAQTPALTPAPPSGTDLAPLSRTRPRGEATT